MLALLSNRTIWLAVILTVVGKLTSFGLAVVLSSVYGASPSTDAYFIANTVPAVMWTASLTTIGLVFMPLYTAARQRSVSAASKFANDGVQLYTLLALVLSTLCIIGSPWIVSLTAPGAPAETKHIATILTAIMGLGFFFTGYVSIQNAILQSNRNFLSPLAVTVFINAVTMLGIGVSLWFGGIYTVITFSLLGWILQAVLQRMQTLRFYQRCSFALPDSTTSRRLIALSLPVMAGVLLDQLNLYIGTNLGSGFGPGAISHLAYAGRLTLFLSGMVSMLVSYFLFPRLASAAARDDHAGASSTVTLGTGLVALGTMPIAILAIMYAPQMVYIVFERGKFGVSDASATAGIFQLYALGILFIGLREILNRVFYSYQRNTAPLLIGLVAAVTNLAASWFFMHRIGIAGIAAGSSLGAAVYVVGQVVYIALWRGHLFERAQLRWFALIALASLAMVSIAWLTQGIDTQSAFLNLLVSGGAGVLAYGAVALAGARAIQNEKSPSILSDTGVS